MVNDGPSIIVRTQYPFLRQVSARFKKRKKQVSARRERDFLLYNWFHLLSIPLHKKTCLVWFLRSIMANSATAAEQLCYIPCNFCNIVLAVWLLSHNGSACFLQNLVSKDMARHIRSAFIFFVLYNGLW